MTKIHIVLKVVLSLIILMPIFGILGVFPSPTPDLYNTQEAFAFILMLMDTKYISILNAIVFAISLYLLWTRREALAAVLIFPITVNVVAFHLVLDGGLLTGGAVLGNIMLAINIYIFWKYRAQYASLLGKRGS